MTETKDIIHISNFKCIDFIELQLNKITVLTGSNSSGKSSLVQSLLLLRSVVEQFHVSETNSGELLLDCNGRYRLGNIENIVRRGADDISIGNEWGHITLYPGERDKYAKCEFVFVPDAMPEWLKSPDFVYLNAERLGPHWESDLNSEAGKYSGVHGEFAANRLYNSLGDNYKVSHLRFCAGSETDNFQIQTDSWMSYVFGDVALKAEKISDKYSRIKVRQPVGYIDAPNAGFGYIYALPIILDGLSLPEGSMLIVENPEAHLHPKAQSNIGFFLGSMAAAGVRVVVETHSEHVVNGIRRGAMTHDPLGHNGMTIYFMPEHHNEFRPIKITMDADGNLSDFPVDFFDQIRQDMKEIYMLAQRNRK